MTTTDPKLKALAVTVRQALLMICAGIELAFGLRPKASNHVTIVIQNDGTTGPGLPTEE